LEVFSTEGKEVDAEQVKETTPEATETVEPEQVVFEGDLPETNPEKGK
jgi:hypothetical protein